MKTNYNRNIGTVSSGTMRPEDLIPDFIWELRQMKPLKREHRKLIKEIETSMHVCHCETPCKGKQAMADNESVHEQQYFDSEDASLDLNEGLFDALDAYALPYFYFGAHPGDGADYGYWLSEGFEDDFDGLKVSDLSEVPQGYTGEVLHVSDHGNPSLYAYSRGRRREIWGLV